MLASGIATVSAYVKSQFLEGLAPADRKAILGAAKQRRYRAHSVVTNQGDPADYLFMLVHGRARYFFNAPEGQKILLYWLVPGEVFGGRAFLQKHAPYLVSTEALSESRMLVWDRATIRNLAGQYPTLMENALTIASDLIAWYTAAHVALTCHSAPKRLAQVLVNLAMLIGEEVPGGVEVDATNEELASAASVTPFTASRLMSEWQRNHAVVKRRGKVVLRSPERLLMHVV
jgi:CRP/FNR family transcriptional regulator, nitrogen oxide reductase regulator